MVNIKTPIGTFTPTETEIAVELSLDVLLLVLTAIAPYVALPLWLVILLPVLKADIPLAEAAFNELASLILDMQSKNVPQEDIIKTLKSYLTSNNDYSNSYYQSWPV